MTKPNAKAGDLRDVKVKALRPHANPHGDKYHKVKGDKYIHPRPAADHGAGLVEIVTEEAKSAPAKSASTKTK
ncbi:hypothetical protein [Erythrobacter rubeus]|uniref:Uncharacterized protein n=1 Tax=Erythrobacter rubeus TaxID=2760803 RepID=A0ABR8KWA1_9SPHN|nr:hypothetical protein [Erythrobacter rubeus]MBD2842704.1 hypothetical protein [Erythrobacter rubeus]